MVVKAIGVYLMLSHFFLGVLGYLLITDEEFKHFKGYDPTKHCGDTKAMNDECNKIAKMTGYAAIGNSHQLQGFPKCLNSRVGLLTNGGGTCIKHVKVLACSWKKGHHLVIGKGQAPNHFMNYDTDNEGICYPYNDIQYKGK